MSVGRSAASAARSVQRTPPRYTLREPGVRRSGSTCASGRRDESHASHPYLAGLAAKGGSRRGVVDDRGRIAAGTDVGAAAMASNEALAAEHARSRRLPRSGLRGSARGDALGARVTCLAASRRDFSTPRRRRRQSHKCRTTASAASLAEGPSVPDAPVARTGRRAHRAFFSHSLTCSTTARVQKSSGAAMGAAVGSVRGWCRRHRGASGNLQ